MLCVFQGETGQVFSKPCSKKASVKRKFKSGCWPTEVNIYLFLFKKMDSVFWNMKCEMF